MHANKVRPYVTRGLQAQKRRGTIDRIPNFKVTKTQERKAGAFASTEAFHVIIKGFMTDVNAYDVDAIDLRDRLNARLSATFCISQPF